MEHPKDWRLEKSLSSIIHPKRRLPALSVTMMQVRRGRWSIKNVQDDGGKSSVGICDEDGEVMVVLILTWGRWLWFWLVMVDGPAVGMY